MNWLYIIVMAYIVISAIYGYHRGFIKVIYSVAALLITVVFVTFVTPLLSGLLQQHTSVYKQFEISCEKIVRDQIDRKLEKDGGLDLDLPEDILPARLQAILEQGAQQSITDVLEAEGVYQKLAETAAHFCVNAIAFLIALVVIRVLLFIIRKKLDIISKVPGIHLLNMIMGFFAGILKAFIVIWAVFLIIKVTALLPASATLITMIEQDAVLTSLYEENPLLHLLGPFDILDRFIKRF